MEYGLTLLRHTLRMVFGNLGPAAWITLLPMGVPLAILILAGDLAYVMAFQAEVMETAQPAGETFDPATLPEADVDRLARAVPGLILGLILLVLGFCWAAVGWHRYVLVEEVPERPWPAWQGGRVFSYLGRSIVVFVVLFVVAMVIGLLAGLLFALAGPGLAVAYGVAVTFALSWIGTRVSLILPAAALDRPMQIGESWAATRPVASDILLPIIVIALVSFMVQQALTVLPPTPELVVSAGVTWLQLLLNLALLTTLYGSLVEGREIR